MRTLHSHVTYAFWIESTGENPMQTTNRTTWAGGGSGRRQRTRGTAAAVVLLIGILLSVTASLGVDLGTSPAFLEVAYRCRDSGQAMLTSATILPRDAANPAVVRFIAPVYRNGAPAGTVEERRKNLQGFVVVAVAAGGLVEEGVAALAPAGLDVYLVSQPASGGERLLWYHPSRTRDLAAPATDSQQLGRSDELQRTADLGLSDERLCIRCSPGPAFIERNITWAPWAGLACGLVLTLLLGAYLIGAAVQDARTARLEEALRASDRRLRLFAENVNDVIWTMDFFGRFTYASPSVHHFLGYTPEELIQLTMDRVLTSASLALARAQLERFIAAAAANERIEGGSLELELVRKDGSMLWGSVTFSGMYDESGKMIAMQGIVHDISEHKQAEARQAELLGRFVRVNELQENLLLPGSLGENLKKITDSAVSLLDLDFCRIWMMERGDLCERGCIHAAATDQRHACRRRDKCLHLKASSGRYTHTDGNHGRVPVGCYKIGRIASAEEKKFLTNRVTTDPRVHNHQWANELGLVSFAGYRLRDTDGKPIGVLAMFAKHPISEQDDVFLSNLAETTSRIILRSQAAQELRAAEETARRENAKLSAMILGMEEGVVFADADNAIVEVNDYFCRFLGMPRDEILGRRIEDFHAGPFLENIAHQIERFRAEAGCEPFVLQRPIGDAEVILRMQPVYRDGKYDGVLLNVIDVSELVEARREAEAATRTKCRFLANMSHEIRTPMTAILGYADLLMDPTLSSSARNNYLAVIRRSGEHLLQLINDILDLSKIESGKMPLSVERLDVTSLLADVSSMMRPRAAERGVSLTVRYATQVPQTISTDGGRLRQALVNLVGNAVKFTERGSVRIVASFLADWRDGRPAMKIEVVDTGIGIPEEVLPRLFQPFTQADASTSRKFGGTGLGLAISHQVAEMLEGELTAKSVLGQGSTFTLTIPAGDLEGIEMLQHPGEAEHERENEHRLQTTDDLQGVRILLAEDGFDNREVIRAMLLTARAEVETAEDGQIAVARAQAEPFDVILMDMNMPVMDGYRATRTLRDQGYAGPILALTANGMSGDKERCVAAGCNDYLVKPIDRVRMIQTIAARVRNETVASPAAESETQAGPIPGEPCGEGEIIVSQFAGEPEMAEILEAFVQRLAGQVAAMREALDVGKYEYLQRLAHSLKGSGGSYGYPSLTEASRALEQAARAKEIGAARTALDTVAATCEAIQEGYVPCAAIGSATP